MGFLVILLSLRSFITPLPSGIMCVAQRHVSLSVVIKILRFRPVEVGKTSPVKVCMRHFTPAILAAIMLSSPALGVMLWTISGLSLRKTRISLSKDLRSLNGAIFLSMGTAMVLTPSSLAISSSSLSGEERATTSYSAERSLSRSLQKTFIDTGMVDTLMSFFFSIPVPIRDINYHTPQPCS